MQVDLESTTENAYSYVELNPIVYLDAYGLYKHKPGGPEHEGPGEKLSCKNNDSMDTILRKIRRIKEIIDSHRKWEKIQPGRHTDDLNIWENALNNCLKIKKKKDSRAIVPVPSKAHEYEFEENTAKAVGIGCIIYWVVSEASRIIFPPRNLIPVP